MWRSMRRRALAVGSLAGGFTLLAGPAARAATDVFSNIGPASALGGAGKWLRYPVSSYGLDQHFTIFSASITGGVDASGVIPEVAWFFASFVWFLTSGAAWAITELFAFAFSLDLLNGSSATGGAGALGPVSQAIHSIYAHVFGAPWLVLALTAVAVWAMWKALVQRRYSETAGALAMSLIYIVIAFFFVAVPGQTIGTASEWTNEMSQAFLSVSTHGSPSGGEAAVRDDADQVWSLTVQEPWSVLEFGGVEHCAIDGTGDDDSDPESAPVRPLSADPGQDSALARRLADGTEVGADGKTCVNNLNKYAAHFLRFGFLSDERGEEYDALNDGDSSKVPGADKEKAGYKLGVADKPATDAMEEGGQYQRLGLAFVVAIGDLGAFLLLGSLSVLVILSQVLLLLLLAFSPVALVAAAIPGRGHDFFKSWLEKLGGYLLRKAGYSLVLAVLLAVNGAIAGATSQLGWLFSFGLQSAFFWAVLIQRRTLMSGIVGIATGPRSIGGDLALDAIGLYAGARLGLAPIRGAGRVARGAGGFAYRGIRNRRADRQSRNPVGMFGSRYSKDVGFDLGPSAGGGGNGGGSTGGGPTGGGGTGGGGPSAGGSPGGEVPAGGEPGSGERGRRSGGREGGGKRFGGAAGESSAGGSTQESVAAPTDEREGKAAARAGESTAGRRRAAVDRPPDAPREGDAGSSEGNAFKAPADSPERGAVGGPAADPPRTRPGGGRHDGDDAASGKDPEGPNSPQRRRAKPKPPAQAASTRATAGAPVGPDRPQAGSELSDELRVERESRVARSPADDPEPAPATPPSAAREPVAAAPPPDEPSSPPRRRRRFRIARPKRSSR